MKHVMLYFGSFNPIHKGHIAIAEYVIEQNLCDQVAMIVSPQNPLKPAPELAAELMRFEMVEAACAASRYPDRIVASAVEFLLERPSYTVNTLRFLEQQTEGKMRLSILMGSDLINNIDRWREYQYIIDNYDIYVYPRKGVPVTKFADRIHLLADAPAVRLLVHSRPRGSRKRSGHLRHDRPCRIRIYPQTRSVVGREGPPTVG